MPAEFVAGRAGDGRPQVSHAWARTIDGVQGGTWDQVHLLATPALDRYRGYVGQSRSIYPTHTWNTTPAAPPTTRPRRPARPSRDSTTAEQIAAALARAQPKTFAADDDPYRIEADVRAEQDHHRTHLKQRPPDLTERITQAEATVQARGRDLADWDGRLAHWHQQQSATSGLRGLTRSRRQAHHQAAHHVDTMTPHLEQARHHLDQALAERGQLVDEQSWRQQFDAANQWRAERISQLDCQIAQHWTDAVTDAARDGHPTAYGTRHLQAARTHLSTKTVTEDDPALPGVMADLQLLDHALHDLAQQRARHLATRARSPAVVGVHRPVEHAAYPELAPARSGPELTI